MNACGILIVVGWMFLRTFLTVAVDAVIFRLNTKSLCSPAVPRSNFPISSSGEQSRTRACDTNYTHASRPAELSLPSKYRKNASNMIEGVDKELAYICEGI